HTRFSRDWSSDVCSSDLAAKFRCGGFRKQYIVFENCKLITAKANFAAAPFQQLLYAQHVGQGVRKLLACAKNLDVDMGGFYAQIAGQLVAVYPTLIAGAKARFGIHEPQARQMERSEERRVGKEGRGRGAEES